MTPKLTNYNSQKFIDELTRRAGKSRSKSA